MPWKTPEQYAKEVLADIVALLNDGAANVQWHPT